MPARRRSRSRTTRRGAAVDVPAGRSDPLTPAGVYESTLLFISGLLRLRGWRRNMARVAALVAVLAIIAIFVHGLVVALGR